MRNSAPVLCAQGECINLELVVTDCGDGININEGLVSTSKGDQSKYTAWYETNLLVVVTLKSCTPHDGSQAIGSLGTTGENNCCLLEVIVVKKGPRKWGTIEKKSRG